MKSLSNISLQDFRRALTALGLKCDRKRGGHEAWAKEGMSRPVIIQTHVDPVREFIVKNTLRNLGISRQEFISLLENL